MSISARQLGYDQGRFDEAFFFTGRAASVGQKSDSRESLQHTNRGANIFD
jgi:hypothetical protein